jgi:hypothetical protein
MSFLPNIRDDAINAQPGLTQGSMSNASYAQLFIDFLRRSRQSLTDDLHSIRFSNGLANFLLQTLAKSHRSQQKGYNIPMVKLKILG